MQSPRREVASSAVINAFRLPCHADKGGAAGRVRAMEALNLRHGGTELATTLQQQQSCTWA